MLRLMTTKIPHLSGTQPHLSGRWTKKQEEGKEDPIAAKVTAERRHVLKPMCFTQRMPCQKLV